MAAPYAGVPLALLTLMIGLGDVTGAFLAPSGTADTTTDMMAVAMAPAPITAAAAPVAAPQIVIEPQTQPLAEPTPIQVVQTSLYDPIGPESLLPAIAVPPPAEPAPVQVETTISAVQAAPADPQAAPQPAGAFPAADTDGQGLAPFEVSADDQYRIASASMLKDVTPFAPGSGPNTSNRMGEWLASDRTIKNINSVRAFTVMRMGAYGWGIEEWPALDRLWWHESGWAPIRSDGDTSRAWGIPQALPASKMAKWGDDYLTNPATQVNWGLDYIASRYGTPTQAWEFWKAQARNGGSAWY